MPINYGIKYGTIKGVLYGPGGSLGPPPVAPFDGPSGWYVPASNADMAALGITNATAIHGFQEASGSIIDLTGGGMDLAATGTVGYRAAVPGWVRLAATVSESLGGRFGRTSVQSPLYASTSVLWVGYVAVTSSASVRAVLVGSDSAAATELAVRKSAADVPSIKVAAVAANGTVNMAGPVGLVALLWDVTNSRVCAYTNGEKRTGTFGAIAEGNKGWGTGVSLTGGLSLLWGAVWTGAAAELTDAQVKSRLQALNIRIPWT